MLLDHLTPAATLDVTRLIGKFVAPAKARSPWMRYGLGCVLPFVGFFITWNVFHLHRAPYFTLFMASVVITSLFGGTGPGLLNTVISSILAFLVAPPAWTFQLSDGEDATRIGLFTVLGVLISTIVGVVGELQRELNRERGTLATTLRSIGDGVVTTDKNGNITFLNDVAQQATGCSLADALGKPVEAIAPLPASIPGRP